jgi:hypothetical protein
LTARRPNDFPGHDTGRRDSSPHKPFPVDARFYTPKERTMNHNKHTSLVWYGLKLDGEIVAALHSPFEPPLVDFRVTLTKEQAKHRTEVVRVQVTELAIGHWSAHDQDRTAAAA